MRRWAGLIAACVGAGAAGAAPEWQRVEGGLTTRWSSVVQPAAPLPEHPRPMMARPSWISLNGLWEYSIRPRDEGRPAQFDGRILVPFPVESALSGVGRTPGADNALWYKRRFVVGPRPGRRRLLHFAAVDWETTVWLNGREIGTHRGGYTPFTFDITDMLVPSGSQELILKVWDPCDKGIPPCGKQTLEPKGMRYTGSSGIWGTVWLEDVPAVYIRSVVTVPDLDGGGVRITVHAPGAPSVKVAAYDGQKTAGMGTGKPGEPFFLKVNPVKPWSPSDPFLYGLRVGAGEDMVTGYFGLRKIEVKRADDGYPRVFLNHQPIFLLGPFIQGYWPDGLYTAPTDDALRWDLETIKKMGFNFVLAHMKVEPQRWYYWCDRLGLVVWEELPDSRKTKDDPDAQTNFRQELQEIVDALRNHPSIAIWSPFHRDWGVFDVEGITAWLRSYDPTRLVSNMGGGTPAGVGDIQGLDVLGGRFPAPGEGPALFNRFGVRDLHVPGHIWSKNPPANMSTKLVDVSNQYADEMGRLRTHQMSGVAIEAFTHFADTEEELHGLVTYDREVMKVSVQEVAGLNEPLLKPAGSTLTLVGCAFDGVQTMWRYTTVPPPEKWFAVDFDASQWGEGPGAFGNRDPGLSKWIATTFEARDVWIRREFVIDGEFSKGLYLRLIHDDDVEVYLNGEKVYEVKGYTGDYKLVPLAAGKLKNGKNILAGHCNNGTGAHILDIGIVEIK